MITTPIKIGVSVCDNRYDEYKNWFQSTPITVEIIDLFYKDNNLKDFDKCDALILTGGVDINPKLYGKIDQIKLCKGVNDLKDEFEFNLIDKSLNHYIPIFGVCRGMQIVNISNSFQGTMICDIPTTMMNCSVKIVHSNSMKEGANHQIEIKEGTLLSEIVQNNVAEVNSFHHQAIETVGNGLVPSSKSSDGIIESLEWQDKSRIPFLFLVQWHPERMLFNSKLSGGILKYFYENI